MMKRNKTSRFGPVVLAVAAITAAAAALAWLPEGVVSTPSGSASSAGPVDASVSAKVASNPGATTTRGQEAGGQEAGNAMAGWRVRCDHGASLAQAVRHAPTGAALVVSGICTESIEITTDRLTLRGLSGATIDGGSAATEAVVNIKGARGVVLQDLIVQNGADQGVLASGQAQVILNNVVARDNGTLGVSVDRSHLDVSGLTLTGNGSSGLDAYTSSTVVLRGQVTASGNGGDGLVANGKTFLELRGAVVTASNNAGSGVSVINDSRLQIFSFPEAQGSTITADSNGFAGVGVLGAAMGVVGSQYFGSGANVITATNNLFGFFMPAGSILSPHATAKFVANNNFIGMLIEDGGSLLVVGGLDVTQNSVGISASGAGTLTMVSIPTNPSTVDANQTDMALDFGTRATIDGVAFTSLVCDGTALVRGSASCP